MSKRLPAYAKQLRVNGRFASAIQWSADRQLRVLQGKAKPLKKATQGTPKQRTQLEGLLKRLQEALKPKPVRRPKAKSVEVIESYKESVEGSRHFDKHTPGAVYERHDGKGKRGKWRRTVFGRINAYRWDFKTMYDAGKLLVELNTQYDSYRVPGTLNRVVARIEVWYETGNPHEKNGVSSPYDWIPDVNLYTFSWEEKASSQIMLAALNDHSRLIFTVELLLPDLAIAELGEPDF